MYQKILQEQLLFLALKFLSAPGKSDYTNLYKALDVITVNVNSKRMNTKNTKNTINTRPKKFKPTIYKIKDIPYEVIIDEILPLLEVNEILMIRKLNKYYKYVFDDKFKWAYYFYYKYVKEFEDYFEKKFKLHFINDRKLNYTLLDRVYPKYLEKIKDNWKVNFMTFYNKMKIFTHNRRRYFWDEIEQKEYRRKKGESTDGDELYIFHILKYNAKFLNKIVTENKKFIKYALLIVIKSESTQAQYHFLRTTFDSHIKKTEYANDVDIALALMSEDPWFYNELGKDVQENIDVVSEAVKSDGYVLGRIINIHPRFLDDPEILTEAIKSQPDALFFCSLKYKRDIKFVSIALTKHGSSIKYLPAAFYVKNYSKEQLKDLFLLAGRDVYALKYIINFLELMYYDEDFVFEVVESLIRKSLLLNHDDTIRELARIYKNKFDFIFRIFKNVLEHLEIKDEVLQLIKK